MDFPIGETLSNKFKLLRRYENLSQRGLATETGIPPTTIAAIETGKIKVISTEMFNRFVDSDRMAKYAFWLLKDDIDDETVDAMLAFRGTDQEEQK